MNNKGITYFRLKSPYEGDITKNCSLDGYEVDNNFFTLEGRDIKSVYVENDEIHIKLINGNVIKSGDVFSKFTKDLSFEFDSEKGILYVKQNGTVKKIEGFATEYGHDFSVATDGTIKGTGKPSKPLSLSPLYRTGTYSPVKAYINMAESDCNEACHNGKAADKLPSKDQLLPGDRFLVCMQNSDYGMLYNYDGVKKIACDLIGSHSEWRIPTKEDWDDMLNAIEPFEEDKNHGGAASNTYFGRFAGKFLKSKYLWKPEHGHGHNEHHYDHHHGHDHGHMEACGCGKDVHCHPMHCGEYHTCHHKHCKGDASGVDCYNFGITPAGYADDGRLYGYFGERCAYWTATNSHSGASAYVKRFDFDKSSVYQDIVATSQFLSLRLVKDYNGDNYSEREDILNGSYPTLMMPSVKGGHKIWTSVNVAFMDKCYNAIQPNNGQNLSLVKKYFIYEWNGKGWMTNEMKEGETVVILNGPTKRYSTEYKVINGELIDLEARTANEVIGFVKPKLYNLEALIEKERERAMEAEHKISHHAHDTAKALDSEITERKDADLALNEALETEKTAREEGDKDLQEKVATVNQNLVTAIDTINQNVFDGFTNINAAIEAEGKARADKDAELEAQIAELKEGHDSDDNEVKEALANLETKLEQEVEDRKKADTDLNTELTEKIDNEVTDRTEADEALKNEFTEKIAATDKAVEELGEKVDQEIQDRTEADEAIKTDFDQKLDEEKTAREEADKNLKEEIEEKLDSSDEAIKDLGEKLEEEATARATKDAEIEGKLLTEIGTEFDPETGVLTLKSSEGTNDITVQFSFNFGEI